MSMYDNVTTIFSFSFDRLNLYFESSSILKLTVMTSINLGTHKITELH